jgi:formylglycine-generating enzyme required for sulfatase activity
VGAHPLIADSGWNSSWNAELPPDTATLIADIKCSADSHTWTDVAGANETHPINCVSWYEAFAFCAWDGGRIPTEAEWEYATAGGDENRLFPWGDDTSAPLPANYYSNHYTAFLDVGTEPLGAGRWGHLDLAGSMWEWVLDVYAADWYTTTEAGCTDCVNLSATDERVARGGGWYGDADGLRATYRLPNVANLRFNYVGIRCARETP